VSGDDHDVRATLRGAIGRRVRAALCGRDGPVDNLETILVVMVALATSGLAVMAFAGWWVNGSIQAGTEALEERADGLKEQADGHSGKLASISTELHHARAELTTVRAEIGLLRAELGAFIHGPPSLRSPVVSTEKTS
jgi:hypothetical protein